VIHFVKDGLPKDIPPFRYPGIDELVLSKVHGRFRFGEPALVLDPDPLHDLAGAEEGADGITRDVELRIPAAEAEGVEAPFLALHEVEE